MKSNLLFTLLLSFSVRKDLGMWSAAAAEMIVFCTHVLGLGDGFNSDSVLFGLLRGVSIQKIGGKKKLKKKGSMRLGGD